MTIDLTPIINAALVLIGAILTTKLMPYLKARMTAEQYARMDAAIKVAVYAAEEVYRGGHGEEKLAYAESYLKGKGFEVDLAQIKAAVQLMRATEVVQPDKEPA